MTSNQVVEVNNECDICCCVLKEKNIFRCFGCKAKCCIKCMKIYLLGSGQEPHCAHCRTAMEYDVFVDKFDKTWRLGPYKTHKEKMLWDIEQAQFPATVGYIDLKKRLKELSIVNQQLHRRYYEYVAETNKYKRMKQNEDRLNKTHSVDYKKVLRDLKGLRETAHGEWLQVHQQVSGLQVQINDFLNKKKNIKYTWTQPCPATDCKGFLNSDYKCGICDKKYCKHCLENISSEEHKCNEELVETIKAIRKESRPCPTCGEYISKISGCDQMFCTGCGTAFSWTTGQIEQGIIHNPHAHHFFKNNPQALEEYTNRRNGMGGAGGDMGNGGNCRGVLPTYFRVDRILDFIQINESELYENIEDIDVISDIVNQKYAKNIELLEKLRIMFINLAEFNQYGLRYAERYINNFNDNLKLREDYLNGILSEKKFKTILHMRCKKTSFQKLIHEYMRSTLMICGELFWNISEVKTTEDLERYYNMLCDIRNDTNKYVLDVQNKHNYKGKLVISEYMEIPRYWN